MLNCRQATQLISEQQERALSVTERLRLRMHLALCDGCRNFRLQIPFLSRAMRAYSERLDAVLEEAEAPSHPAPGTTPTKR